jgi:hypothetical protein
MRILVGFLVGVLVGVMLVGGGYALAQVRPGGMKPPVEWQSIQGGMARLEIAQDGVVCYARVGGGPGGIYDLTCLKVK